jgi:hypothetical protein
MSIETKLAEIGKAAYTPAPSQRAPFWRKQEQIMDGIRNAWTRRRCCGLYLLALTLLAGCAGTGRPKWLNPGNADSQQAKAEVFDPYPQNNIGPDTVSTRPPGFEHEYPEVQRARPWDQRSKFRQWAGF